MAKILHKGKWYRLGSNGGNDSGLKLKDGLVCTKLARVQVGGVNALGLSWRQEEIAQALDEPYLNEWGYRCCLDECTEENHNQPVEIYKWLYRCMKEGFSVPTRTIVITGADGVERSFAFNTLAAQGTEAVNAALETEFGLESGSLSALDSYKYDFDACLIHIPVLQFAGLSYEELRRYVSRVQQDNPELFYPNWPDSSKGNLAAPYDGDIYNMGVDGGYSYLFSVRPADDAVSEMVSACRKVAAVIQDKIYRYYEISPGTKLTLEQKKQVAKVIHDHLILHGNYSGHVSPALLSSMYSVMDQSHKGYCLSYTQAFNFVARMYGIEALYMSGIAYQTWNGSEYEDDDSHAWNLLSLTDDYGNYSADPSDWTCVDIFWDEGLDKENETEDALGWTYFMDKTTVFRAYGDVNYRAIKTDTGYGKYPFDHEATVPSASYPYEGNTPYVWD